MLQTSEITYITITFNVPTAVYVNGSVADERIKKVTS